MNKVNSWIIDYEVSNIHIYFTTDKHKLDWKAISPSEYDENGIIYLSKSDIVQLKESSETFLYENKIYYIGISLPSEYFELNYLSDAKNIFYNQFVSDRCSFFPKSMYKHSEDGCINIIGEFKTNFNIGVWDFSIKLSVASLFRDIEVYLPVHPDKINFENEYTTMLNDISLEVSELLVKYTTSNISQIELEVTNRVSNFRKSYIHLRQCIHELISVLEEVKLKPYIKSEQIKIVSYIGTHSSIDTIELASNYMRYDPQQGGPLAARLKNTTPRLVPEIKNKLTYDNLPNQYLKFVLNSFVNILIEALEYFSLKKDYSLYCVEINKWLEYFEENLQYGFLKEVTLKSTFTDFNSQVLYRRQSYKEIFKIVEKYNSSIQYNLSFLDVETEKYYVKPVYELYEMWCFLIVKKLLNRLLGTEQSQTIVSTGSSEISINLQKGKKSEVIFEHNNTIFKLFYNKTYKSPDSSYSLNFIPDISIECIDKSDETTKVYHLDAKYKLEKLILDSPEGDVEVKTHTKNDIYKMHAYKDSICNTVASYILYPGDQVASFLKKTDSSEGVGAFNLIPGKVNDIDSLEKHLQTLLSL